MRVEGLRPARDIDGFLADPVGRYLAGSKFVTWVYHPRLLGNIYAGNIDEDDLGWVARLFTLPGCPGLRPPLRAVIDGRQLASLHLPQYEVLRRYAGSFLDGYLPMVDRLAVVRPPGLIGATVAGLYHDLLEPSGKAVLFDDAAAAFDWLGDAAGRQAHAATEALFAEVLRLPLVLRRLRDLLDEASGRPLPTLGDAARALGVSARSLQRDLQASDTSFRAEARDARMRRAAAILDGSSSKLEAVTREVGCSSVSHLVRTFERTHGRPPGAYRGK